MSKIPKWTVVKTLWEIYLDACLCATDYNSSCDCGANDLAADALEQLLGKRWHDKCRRRFS